MMFEIQHYLLIYQCTHLDHLHGRSLNHGASLVDPHNTKVRERELLYSWTYVYSGIPTHKLTNIDIKIDVIHIYMRTHRKKKYIHTSYMYMYLMLVLCVCVGGCAYAYT